MHFVSGFFLYLGMLQPRFQFLNHSVKGDLYQSKIRNYIESFLEDYEILDAGGNEAFNFKNIIDNRVLLSFSHSGTTIKNPNGDWIDLDYGFILLTAEDGSEFRFDVNPLYNKK